MATGLTLVLTLAWVWVATAGDASVAEQASREQITALALGVTAFQGDVGRFPSREEGLSVLLRPPAGEAGGRWRGPYIDGFAEGLADPWGHPYVYVPRPADAERPFSIYSTGPDGCSASAGADPDDVSLWAEGPVPHGDASELLPSPSALRVLRRPLGLVLVLTLAVAALKWYTARLAAQPSAHPDGYVRRHLRRRSRTGLSSEPPQGLH